MIRRCGGRCAVRSGDDGKCGRTEADRGVGAIVRDPADISVPLPGIVALSAAAAAA
jgi:hypothetical protein